ncbi:dnaJ homolog subfamily C member 21-like [Oppia nitens]|uniref:dnaJ homolog subfamily C member 21-like n=1 Tax=Oppia nitens TaxID=1686743 RepID=UPI0023DB268D|nr:dnaJ homolog subfamily C member 21-like [Oppia nitens]
MPKKRCYYEIMGLAMDATDEDIKRAYRQLALSLHPDKNPDNQEMANNEFKVLQEAYEVLSDPRERKWYDKHRDAILCGQDRDDIVDKEVDVYPYCSSFCYQSFSDDANGFYTVYRNLFKTIADEDLPFRDSDDKDYEEIPEFGNSKTPYSDVHQFYSYWMSYCTAKTYSYFDKYNILDAPNRRVARLIEKENKKIRDAARKKRNEEIRSLVEYVRKRDKRVAENRRKLEAKAEENKRKSEMIRKQQIEARNKELENYQESEWTSMAALEDNLKEIEQHLDDEHNKKKKSKKSRKLVDNTDTIEDMNGENEDEDDNEYEDNLYCIACDKAFKSDKAFANHENSKKHKTNIAFLRQQLESDDQLIDNSGDS